jgi:peptide/nickel transport system permease protein
MSDYKSKTCGPADHYVAPHGDGNIAFAELQDAPPAAKFKLSVTGWIGAVVVAFWVFIALFGQVLAPYGENALPFPDAYSEYQHPQPGAWLGTDVDDRDILSRIMYGAGRTLGISPSRRRCWPTSSASFWASVRRSRDRTWT